MMSELKRALKLMKYAYGVKTTILIVTAMTIAVFAIFYGFYNKFYFSSLILCFLMYFVIDICSTVFFVNHAGVWVNHNKVLALLLGLLIIVMGSVISMVLRRLFYKKSASRYSGSSGLRKGME